MPILTDLTNIKRGMLVKCQCDNPNNNPNCLGIYEVGLYKKLLTTTICRKCGQMSRWTPERRKNHSQIIKERWANPEYKKRLSNKMLDVYKSDAIREKIANAIKSLQTPEMLKLKSEKSKSTWLDNDIRNRRVVALKQKYRDADYRERRSKHVKSQEFREEMRKMWRDPQKRRDMICRMKQSITPEVTVKRLIAHKKNLSKKGVRAYVSKPQELLHSVVYSQYPDAIINDHSVIKGILIDVTIPSLKIAIEYDGFYFHKKKMARDITRMRELHAMGWRTLNFRICSNGYDITDAAIFKKEVRSFIHSKKQYKWVAIWKPQEKRDECQLTII